MSAIRPLPNEKRPLQARFSAILGDAESVGCDLSPEQLPEALADLERVRARLMLRLTAAGARSGAPEEDRLLTVEAAAKRLALAPDTLYRKAKDLPFTVRIGHQVRFSSVGIDKFIRSRQRKP
jgi:predicted DNA-binding transcriptional regulator AlpA